MQYAKKIINSIYHQNEAIPVIPQQKSMFKAKHDTQFIKEIELFIEKINDVQNCLINPTYLKDIVQTLKGLIIVISDLKTQYNHVHQISDQYEIFKNKVNNHNNIIKSIEQMYQKKMLEIKEELLNTLKQKQQIIKAQSLQIQEFNKKYIQMQQKQKTTESKVIQLNKTIEYLNNENKQIHKKLGQLNTQIRSYHTADHSKIFKIEDLEQKQYVQIMLQSKMTNHILDYLEIEEILKFKYLNKRINFIIKTDHRFSIYLIKRIKLRLVHQKKLILKDIKQYQNIIEIFPIDNLRVSALKYIYFKIKPGQYMIDLFSTLKGEEFQKKSKPIVTQKKSFFNSLFKQEQKKEQNKFNLRDLANDEYFKKVEKKMEDFFSTIFNISNSNCLNLFKDSMLQQFKELKQSLSDDNQILKLYSYSKFMYLETQQIHKLSVCLFSLLMENIKKYNQIFSTYQDIKQSYQSSKNILNQLVEQKSRIQQQNWKMEIEYLKYKNDNNLLLQQSQKQMKELIDLRKSTENQAKNIHFLEKKLDQLSKKNKNYQKQFQTITNLLELK